MKPGSIPKPLTIPSMQKTEKAKAEPEVKPISYQDCANAMLMMWMDKILSDGEYYLIMSKLNKYYGYFEGKEDKDE